LCTSLIKADGTPGQVRGFCSIPLPAANKLTSHRKERAQTGFAQVKSSPDKDADDHRQIKGLADAHMRGGCAAEIAGEQDRAENGCARDGIDDRTDDFDDADGL